MWPRCSTANGGGFSLDVTVRIEADDRAGLERLIRYCARPPFSGERLREEGNSYVYIPKKPGPYGRGATSMSASELLEKLFHLIPPQPRHRHHYHGVFAPNARLRPKVVALTQLQPKIVRSDPIESADPNLESRSVYHGWKESISRWYKIRLVDLLARYSIFDARYQL